MMIPHNKVTRTREDFAAVDRVLKSGHVTMGPEVQKLEEEFCAYTGRKYAIAVSTGSAALRLALLSRRDLTPVVPAYSCVALANAAMFCHPTKIHLADCTTNRSRIWTIDTGPFLPNAIVVALNTFGVKADMHRLLAHADFVIEDCTHGFGEHQSDIEILSLRATKLIGGDNGGMILTDISDVADFCRDHRSYDDKPACFFHTNDALTDTSAALARAKLARLNSILAERKELAEAYMYELASAAGSELLALPPNGEHTWYRFVVTLPPEKMAKQVCETMKKEHGICVEQPIEWWPEGEMSTYPVAETAYLHNVSLPLYPGLTKYELIHVCEKLVEVLR